MTDEEYKLHIRLEKSNKRIKDLEADLDKWMQSRLDSHNTGVLLSRKLKIAVEAITELGDRVVEMHPDDLEKWSFEALSQIAKQGDAG